MFETQYNELALAVELIAELRTRVPSSQSSSLDVLLARTRLAWGTLRVICVDE